MRDRAIVSGIPVSHPDRVVYPELGITKLDVARYCAAVGGRMVPHLTGRPLTLVHCPQGLGSPCAYLRHTKVWGPDVLRRVRLQEKTKVGEYLIADDERAIVGLAQMGVLEIHTWNATDDDIERPNRIIWDLDPGAAVTWRQTIAAARLVREVLQALGLQTWVKTTGGRGLHVVMPLIRQREWPECLAFARMVADNLARAEPALYTKRGRESKILIDYLRNDRTNTSVAALSTRARAGATVSMPVAWTELIERLNPSSFTIATVPKRLARMRNDPWKVYWQCRQRIRAAALRALERV